MPIELKIKRVQLWVLHDGDRKGLLADVLQPLVEAGAELQAVLAYRFPDQLDRAEILVFPVDGRSAEAAARGAGFAVSDTPCLLVEGEDRRGLSARIAREIADARVSMAFHTFQAVGQKFSALIGLDSEQDAATVTRTLEALARNFHR
jgi:hypothetical protein